MSIIINPKYIGDTFKNQLGISYTKIYPPVNQKNLKGYVMIIKTELVSETACATELYHGNEWDKKNCKFMYMYEKEEKIKGHSFKRHRFSENELYIMYQLDQKKNFIASYENRKSLFDGSGFLIYAQYNAHDEDTHYCFPIQKWLLVPEESTVWAYQFDYDPLRNTGKHNMSARGFSVMKRYNIENLKLFYKNEPIYNLLNQITEIENLSLDPMPATFIMENDNYTPIKGWSNNLAIMIYKKLPQELRNNIVNRNRYYETEEGKNIKEELIRMAQNIEQYCQSELDFYKTKKIAEIKQQLYERTGINF